MPQTVLKYVAVGTIAMLIPMSIVGLKARIKMWKNLLITLYATVAGTLSTYLWFFVENQWVGGISFYGAVFLVPLAFLLTPYIFREKCEDTLDMFAPGICMMLAVMKLQCFMAGCCVGRELFVNAQGVMVRFPSQLAELINGLVLMVVLLIMAFRKKERGTLYPWFMVLYGITRFILNFFRAEYAENISILPPYGTIWSVVSVIIGGIWLYLLWKKRAKQTASE